MPRPNNGPRLERNARGIWEIRYTEGGRSRRYSTGTADRGAAQQALGAFLLREKEIAVETTRPTVRSVIEAYWDGHLHRAASAVDARRVLDRVKAVLGDRFVEHMGPDDVQHYLAVRGVKPGSARGELALLVAAINWHIRTRRMDPKVKPYLPLPEASPPRERWLTVEECEAVRKEADRQGWRIRLFVELGLETASRTKAILGLKRRHVDLVRRAIDTRPLYSTKRKRGAVVPISDVLLPLLTQACEGLEPDDLVLGGGHGRGVRKALAALAKAAGVEHFSPHTLRHTYGSLALQHGVPIEHIAGVLGDSIQTVERVYAKHDPDRLRGAVNFDRRKTA